MLKKIPFFPILSSGIFTLCRKKWSEIREFTKGGNPYKLGRTPLPCQIVIAYKVGLHLPPLPPPLPSKLNRKTNFSQLGLLLVGKILVRMDVSSGKYFVRFCLRPSCGTSFRIFVQHLFKVDCLYPNIAKGTTDPGVYCFNQFQFFFLQFSQIYFIKDYMMGPLQMPKIMSSYEADRLLC